MLSNMRKSEKLYLFILKYKEKQTFIFHPFKILDIQERNRTIMPEPLVIDKYSRPTLH
jgi:hypothetical protein